MDLSKELLCLLSSSKILSYLAFEKEKNALETTIFYLVFNLVNSLLLVCLLLVTVYYS